MRLAPKRWSTETWWCALKGHVTPAAGATVANWGDAELALPTPSGSRLCRCLRCDAWVNHAEPAVFVAASREDKARAETAAKTQDGPEEKPDEKPPASSNPQVGATADIAVGAGPHGGAATGDDPEGHADRLVPPPPPTGWDPSHLPEPSRGKALDERIVLRLIAIERGLHVVVFVLGALLLAVLEWGLPGVRDAARQLVDAWQGIVSQSRPGQSLLLEGLQEISILDSGRATLVITVLLAYAMLEGVEAFYLWRGRRWAEYLTVVATAALLPLAIGSLLNKVSFPRISGLILDLLILTYLVYVKRLFGVRGGYRKLEEINSADVDWPELHRTAPVRPVPIKAGGSADQDTSHPAG
jgi:uncharacterized membrane protein (DUF2068 family)